MEKNRRKFIKQASIAATVLPLAYRPFKMFKSDLQSDDLQVHIFSKHLQFLDYSDAASMAAEMGFAGLDLTVRPKGHVLPENVAIDLPRAVKAIEDAGSTCTLMTTSIESVQNQIDKDILKVASKAGIQFYRTNWFTYSDDLPMEKSIELLQSEVKALGDFNKIHKIVGCYQNHAGTKVGASFWEIEKLLETVDQDYFGTQYDIRHAIAEGGHSWENGLRLLHDNIKVIVLKDFKWGRIDGKWKPVNVPIGEGMVDFTKYFKLLKKYKINVPVSLHLEYPLGGAEKGRSEITVDKKVVFDAMTKDLNMIQKLWKEA